MTKCFNAAAQLGRWLGAAALAVLLTTSGATAQTAGQPDASSLDRAAVEQIVRDLLQQNPEIVIEAIQTYQAEQERQAQERAQMALRAHRDALLGDTSAPVVGNPVGDVTIVEFFDYRCSFCKRVFPDIQALLEEDKGIRYVMKEFPILGEESQFASRIALAAWNADPSKYMDLHGALMTNRGALSPTRVLNLATASGYDAEALQSAMNGDDIDAALQKSFRLAETLNIRGTPAFIIGDEVIPGAIGIERMRELIQEARGS